MTDVLSHSNEQIRLELTFDGLSNVDATINIKDSLGNHRGCVSIRVQTALGLQDSAAKSAAQQPQPPQHETHATVSAAKPAEPATSDVDLAASDSSQKTSPDSTPAKVTPVGSSRTLVLAAPGIGPDAWLYDVIERFGREKRKKWNENTWGRSYLPDLTCFRELIATDKRTVIIDGTAREIFDIRMCDIRANHLQYYKDMMLSYPKNFRQGIRGASRLGLTAKDANKLSDAPPQSYQTALKKFEHTATFLRWTAKDGTLPNGAVLADIFPRKTRKDQEENGYVAFTRKELALIFQGEEYRKMMFGHPVAFWGPLLALYGGIRCNEASQLEVADVMQSVDGIYYFNVTDMPDEDGDLLMPSGASNHRKSVKSGASKRPVPIHPIFFELGFGRYLEHMRSIHSKMLFPGLKFEPNSKFGRLLSDRFRDLTKACGVHQPYVKVLHSLRSNLNEALINIGISDALLNLIMGHSDTSTNNTSYRRALKKAIQNHSLPLRELHNFLSKVTFGLQHHEYEPQESWAKFRERDNKHA